MSIEAFRAQMPVVRSDGFTSTMRQLVRFLAQLLTRSPGGTKTLRRTARPTGPIGVGWLKRLGSCRPK